MIGSNLVTKVIPAFSGNYTKGRSKFSKISEITIHHCAGIMSIESLGSLWQVKNRRGSSHYGVSHKDIGQYVSEDDIAWTNSVWVSNCRAVTIETSNSTMGPNWEVADDTFDTLCKLVADIAKRNNLGTLYLGKNLTWHRMYTPTICPGPYLLSKMQELVDRANAINSSVSAPTSTTGLYRVQVGAFQQSKNAEQMKSNLSKSGFDTFIVKTDSYYRVQVGAFKNKANAESMMVSLKQKGFSGFIVSGNSGSTPNKKSNAEVAKEVIKGLWGNGDDRKKRLSAGGYDPVEIQKEVNKILN